MLHAKLPQPIGVTINAVVPRGDADDRGARSERARDSDVRIFEDHTAANIGAELACRIQVQIGLGLAALDVLAPAIHMRAKRVVEAEMFEMAAQPAGRAGRCN